MTEQKQLSEQDIQTQIRINLSKNGITNFRCNVGSAWTGERIQRNLDGSITIHKPRPFQTGLPTGFSDLLCVMPIAVTPKMLGMTLGITGFIEVKNLKGRIRPEQKNFIEQMRLIGARAGVARSIEDAIAIMWGEIKGS